MSKPAAAPDSSTHATLHGEPGPSNNNAIEATELRDYVPSVSPSSIATAPNDNLDSIRNNELERQRKDSSFKRFWRRQVALIVSHETCRDHFALERTYLGYLRTSVALSILGVVVAQLFRLQHSPTPNPAIGFFVLGIPLAGVCIVAAMLVMILGAHRFWRQQNAIARGKIHVGGWELMAIGGGSVLITFAIFVVIVAVDINKDLDGTS